MRRVSSTGLAATAALCAGLAGALQIAVQGRLGERVGSLEAVATAIVVACVLALALLLLARRSLGGIGEAIAGPKWQLLGGACSVLIVLGITYAAARIGVVATTAFLIAAQFALAAAIDRLGWFGVERIALTWPRLVGICLLALGAALTLRR